MIEQCDLDIKPLRKGPDGLVRVAMFSGGLLSWAAAKTEAQRRGIKGLYLLFCDTLAEDQDTYRFLDMAAMNIGAPLIKIADGRTIWRLFLDNRMIGNSRVDICSRVLKRELAETWLDQNVFHRRNCVVLLGYHISENDRFKRTRLRYLEKGYNCRAPMCEAPAIGYDEIKLWAKNEGLPEHSLYKEGFKHANCGGACIKGGHAQWSHL